MAKYSRELLSCFVDGEHKYWKTLSSEAINRGYDTYTAEERAFYERAASVMGKFANLAGYSGPTDLGLAEFTAIFDATCFVLHTRASKKQWTGPISIDALNSKEEGKK